MSEELLTLLQEHEPHIAIVATVFCIMYICAILASVYLEQLDNSEIDWKRVCVWTLLTPAVWFISAGGFILIIVCGTCLFFALLFPMKLIYEVLPAIMSKTTRAALSFVACIALDISVINGLLMKPTRGKT